MKTMTLLPILCVPDTSRFGEVSEVTTSKYDISSVHETADLSDHIQSVQYCPPIPGHTHSSLF